MLFFYEEIRRKVFGHNNKEKKKLPGKRWGNRTKLPKLYKSSSNHDIGKFALINICNYPKDLENIDDMLNNGKFSI